MGQVVRKIVWTTTAKQDIKQITVYWNNRNKSNLFSIKLRKMIVEKLELIKEFPLLGLKTDYKDVRCLIIRDYKLFYISNEDSIIVLRFWDTRQNPNQLNM